MTKYSHRGSMVILAALLAAGAVRAELSAELQDQARAAIADGLRWLASVQKDDGSWSNGGFPALTALPLEAFLRARGIAHDAQAPAKAIAYVLACARDDGGIYRKSIIPLKGGLATYNTAICMAALHRAGDPAHARIIQKARTFIAGSQRLGDDHYAGGFGYSPNARKTDMLSTLHAVEAMRLTEGVEDLRPASEKRAALDWAAVGKYITSMQNTTNAGAAEAGGFHYAPGKSGAGKGVGADGTVYFRAYGSMTYTGLLGLLYAQVTRDDPRIRSAFDWAARHWSLDENPGLGNQGMYFFYNVLTKALTVYGAPAIPREGAEAVDWRSAVVEKLLALRGRDEKTGARYWTNQNGRFWENDPVLVTAYSIIALENILGTDAPAAATARKPLP